MQTGKIIICEVLNENFQINLLQPLFTKVSTNSSELKIQSLLYSIKLITVDGPLLSFE